mmetsp:Transcript_1984/g.2739  ORF Transcript_1984/g.2739 Transcript_1984/m.2739 type:complete len:275 (+) Transcript_1984:77-901(+)
MTTVSKASKAFSEFSVNGEPLNFEQFSQANEFLGLMLERVESQDFFTSSFENGMTLSDYVQFADYMMCDSSDGCLTMNDSEEKVQSAVAKTYSFFRKYFHVPSMWMKSKDFLDLCQHRYETKDHKDAFVFIEKRLRALGYSEDNQRMLHDYMHYLLMDMLTAVNVPFLTEEDMKESALSKLLDGKTPDLIIKSAGPDSVRPKPLIMDIFVGKGEKAMAEKKTKYSTMKVTFDFTALTVGNYNVELQKVWTKRMLIISTVILYCFMQSTATGTHA